MFTEVRMFNNNFYSLTDTPDYRIPEIISLHRGGMKYIEEDRYYRITPFYRQILAKGAWWDHRPQVNVIA